MIVLKYRLWNKEKQQFEYWNRWSKNIDFWKNLHEENKWPEKCLERGRIDIYENDIVDITTSEHGIQYGKGIVKYNSGYARFEVEVKRNYGWEYIPINCHSVIEYIGNIHENDYNLMQVSDG